VSKALINPLDGLNYFTDQNEPNISYKFEHCNDGFGYFYFCNEGLRTTLMAKVIIESIQGCELFLPFSGRSPKVTVLPQERKVIPYRITNDEIEPVINFKVVASFKRDSEDLIRAALEKGMQFSRQYKGKDVGIDYYILYHNEGLVFYYENNSKYYRLTESVQFNLVNCSIEGASFKESNSNFVLKPGESHIINIVKDQDAERFTANIAVCNYEVEQ
jgi:hypothetical protein